LSAVFLPLAGKLKLIDFRSVNTFLPRDEVIHEATSGEIRELLSHPKLKAQDIDKWANKSNQWFKKRFSLLRASSVLDDYTVQEMLERGATHNVDVHLSDNRIVFPSDSEPAKRLLQLLVEEVFRGAVSGDLFETNSKRKLP